MGIKYLNEINCLMLFKSKRDYRTRKHAQNPREIGNIQIN